MKLTRKKKKTIRLEKVVEIVKALTELPNRYASVQLLSQLDPLVDGEETGIENDDSLGRRTRRDEIVLLTGLVEFRHHRGASLFGRLDPLDELRASDRLRIGLEPTAALFVSWRVDKVILHAVEVEAQQELRSDRLRLVLDEVQGVLFDPFDRRVCGHHCVVRGEVVGHE